MFAIVKALAIALLVVYVVFVLLYTAWRDSVGFARWADALQRRLKDRDDKGRGL